MENHKHSDLLLELQKSILRPANHVAWTAPSQGNTQPSEMHPIKCPSPLAGAFLWAIGDGLGEGRSLIFWLGVKALARVFNFLNNFEVNFLSWP